jgi:hypothetical protein
MGPQFPTPLFPTNVFKALFTSVRVIIYYYRGTWLDAAETLTKVIWLIVGPSRAQNANKSLTTAANDEWRHFLLPFPLFYYCSFPPNSSFPNLQTSLSLSWALLSRCARVMPAAAPCTPIGIGIWETDMSTDSYLNYTLH